MTSSWGLLAVQEPWWEPGTQSGYHADTQGYLLSEIVQRVDGRTLATFFAEEVAGPLDADLVRKPSLKVYLAGLTLESRVRGYSNLRH